MFSWASVRAGTIQLRTRILRATVIVVIPVLFVILLEGAFLLLYRFTADHPDQLTPYLFEFNIPLGYKPIPSADERAFLKDGDRFVFDVAYRTDAYGRRRCPEPSQPATNFTAFFGGSFTFGEGLADADTLPAQFAARTPEMHVYNYGFSGYGPQQVIAKLEEKRLAEEIPQSNGTLVYVFMSAHVRRAIGSLRMWAQWGRHFPYYAYGEDGSVERAGAVSTRAGHGAPDYTISSNASKCCATSRLIFRSGSFCATKSSPPTSSPRQEMPSSHNTPTADSSCCSTHTPRIWNTMPKAWPLVRRT
jgi:hypothetical protein